MIPTEIREREFPGDTTAEDWDDARWVFYRFNEHGTERLSRKARERYPSGRAKPTNREYIVYCEEHFSWEPRGYRVTGKQALAWVQERAKERESA